VLHDLAPGISAYLQPSGSWGLSNAGVVAGGGRALLVDTLYDLARSRALLDAAGRRGTIDVVVNTHANGDHCYGNQLVQGARIVSSHATKHEMPEVPPSLMAWATRGMRLAQKLPWPMSAAPFGPATLRELADYWVRAFGAFEFAGIGVTLPTETFTGALTLTVGDIEAQLIELGPAHTSGDTVVWLPQSRVLFTGDLLFHRGTPIVWAGPLSRWVAACDRMLALDPLVVVPGHGPLADRAALAAERAYLAHVDTAARARHAAKMNVFDAALDVAREIASGRAGDPAWLAWGERERLVVNVDAVYRELDARKATKPIKLFALMAALERELGRA
jgi:glyoxylase-like metal-dependent hydrolase (beta-lactamase superfamily II)